MKNFTVFPENYVCMPVQVFFIINYSCEDSMLLLGSFFGLGSSVILPTFSTTDSARGESVFLLL